MQLRYEAPGGRFGRTIARLFGQEPGQQIHGDLRRLKQVLETGEVVVSNATVRGTGLPQPAAQPPRDLRRAVAAAR